MRGFRALSIVLVCVFVLWAIIWWWPQGNSGVAAEVRLAGREVHDGHLEVEFIFKNTGTRVLGFAWDWKILAETPTGITNFSNFAPEQLELGYRTVHLLSAPGEEHESQWIPLPGETVRWRAQVLYRPASTRDRAMMPVPARFFGYPFVKGLFRAL